MTVLSTYVVEIGKSYPKTMPKIYRLITTDGVETSRYEIIDFNEVSSLAPEVGVEFTEQFKQYLLDIVENISTESGLSEFDHDQFLELESAAIYISNNVPPVIKNINGQGY